MTVNDRLKRLKLALEGNGVTSHVMSAYQRLFNTEDGKIVLEDLCKRYYVYDTLAKPGTDRDEIVLNEGKRSVILFILGVMNVNYALYEEILNKTGI